MEYVVVYKAGPPEAELIRSVLEGHGIPAFVEHSGMGGAYPLTVGDLGTARVFVHADDEARANELIEAAVAGELEGET